MTERKMKLIICYENVGRSQVAEGFANFYGLTDVMSAGVIDSSNKYPSGPHELVKQVMLERDIDISSHRVKPVTPEIVAIAEKILVLCDPEILPDFVKSHPHQIIAVVSDPFGEGIEDFRKMRDEIEQIVIKNLVDPQLTIKE